ncbi:Alpha/Beta hydrolase protein [Blakeslea trispora]|nr:Alpha/Beta hydrolase protein [Blakeslea trispora]
MSLRSDNVQLNYQILGLENNPSNPLVLLIHGAGGDLHHYDHVAPGFVEKGYRVLLMDVRYHGLSQPTSKKRPVVFDFKDVLNDIDRVLEKVMHKHYKSSRETHSLYVGGLSMGGMITLLFAEEKAKMNVIEQLHQNTLHGPSKLSFNLHLLKADRAKRNVPWV